MLLGLNQGAYAVLATLSGSYSPPPGRSPTRYSAVCHSPPKWGVRLACFRHAASVYPEPGSNSPSDCLVLVAPGPKIRPTGIVRGYLLAQPCSLRSLLALRAQHTLSSPSEPSSVRRSSLLSSCSGALGYCPGHKKPRFRPTGLFGIRARRGPCGGLWLGVPSGCEPFPRLTTVQL